MEEKKTNEKNQLFPSLRISNKRKPSQLRRERCLVLGQSARRHPCVRPLVVAPRRRAEQGAAAAGRLDSKVVFFFTFFFLFFVVKQKGFLLGAGGEERQREFALQPPRRYQVPPAYRGLPGDAGAAAPAFGVGDSGEGDVEDLEGDQGVVVGFVFDVFGAAAASVATTTLAPLLRAGEVLRSEDELDRLCVISFLILMTTWREIFFSLLEISFSTLLSN